MKKLIVIISIMLSAFPLVWSGETKDSVKIQFEQGKWELRKDLFHNGERLQDFENRISAQDSSALKLVGRIHITGGASPEGSVNLNKRLSERRAATLSDYLSKTSSLPMHILSTDYLGRDWSGLRSLVATDQDVPYRAEVLSLLDSIVEMTSLHGEEPGSGTLRALRSLRGGIPYSYLYLKHFPALRESNIMVDYMALPMSLVDTAPVLDIPTNFGGSIEPLFAPAAIKQSKPFYMALKSNLLLDAAAIPEIGAEFYLGKNFSIVGNWEYGWWKTDRRHRYWRAYGGDIAIRWWFGKAAHNKPLTGHHIGIYGGVVTYDFEWGGTGYMGGKPGGTLWDRCNRMAGVEYGYSLPIASRLNLDFTLGIGYLGGTYLKYEPYEKWYLWKSTHHLTWFGPTKLEVSLVWLIGHGNTNKAKGGKL